MTFSENCIAVVKHYERFYANPYLCPAGKATIGYGTTIYENGTKVRLCDPTISEADATELLLHHLNNDAADVNRLLKVSVTQSQFDSLCSFSYNEGEGHLEESTLLRLINENIISNNANWKRTVTIEFCRWIYGGGKKLGGLVARRHTEALLFCDDIVKFFN